ncbi:unnamed protein product [Symbiodinium sp. CCMP2592]|nr:unnamed protein product [Symbiodinium sp. CCMP2592]
MAAPGFPPAAAPPAAPALAATIMTPFVDLADRVVRPFLDGVEIAGTVHQAPEAEQAVVEAILHHMWAEAHKQWATHIAVPAPVTTPASSAAAPGAVVPALPGDKPPKTFPEPLVKRYNEEYTAVGLGEILQRRTFMAAMEVNPLAITRGVLGVIDGIEAVRWAWTLTGVATEKGAAEYAQWWTSKARQRPSQLEAITEYWDASSRRLAMQMNKVSEGFNPPDPETDGPHGPTAHQGYQPGPGPQKVKKNRMWSASAKEVSDCLGVEPALVCASDFGWISRPRLWWLSADLRQHTEDPATGAPLVWTKKGPFHRLRLEEARAAASTLLPVGMAFHPAVASSRLLLPWRRREPGARARWLADSRQFAPWHYTEEAMLHDEAGRLHNIPVGVKEALHHMPGGYTDLGDGEDRTAQDGGQWVALGSGPAPLGNAHGPYCGTAGGGVGASSTEDHHGGGGRHFN